ncbi:hypothetical protein, partial [Bradyrhizobium sp. NBAIM08]|uniref:hypothetical protein n=1 Tax=Bradyrhizobium sp. NBAIM08 TaxID=2793815 RepID=UPI001CD27883
MQQLSLGLVSSSRKENERRLPIHPRHLHRLDPALRDRVFLEHGYGDDFGLSDAQLRPHVAGLLSRRQLVQDCDVVMLPKPLAADVAELSDGQVLWG